MILEGKYGKSQNGDVKIGNLGTIHKLIHAFSTKSYTFYP